MEGAYVTSKNIVPEPKKENLLFKKETIAPVISAASGLTGFATGSGPFQWALAAIMVIGAALLIYWGIKQMKESEA